MKSITGRKPLSAHPCIFGGRFVREQVDPRVKDLWSKATGKPTPFGRLRKIFKGEHCARINPFGGECPYHEEECAMAFLSAVQNSLLPWIKDPAAYFVKVAASSGMKRADNKPLAREMHRAPQGSSDAAATGAGPSPGRSGNEDSWNTPQGAGLRGPGHRPESIGSLLGTFNFGSHQGSSTNGDKGSK